MNNIEKRYNEVYKRGIELCPDMQEVIEQMGYGIQTRNKYL